MTPLYLYMHIPKTGGTGFTKMCGEPFIRKTGVWQYHYNWIDKHDTMAVSYNLPSLEKRTEEQQEKIKIVTGHGVSGITHHYFKVKREPRYVTTLRHPIERLLSSFNYRYAMASLTQDPSAFYWTEPRPEEKVIELKKDEKDYNTLYEWYLDYKVEHNLQTKWLINCFFEQNGHKLRERNSHLIDPHNSDERWFEYQPSWYWDFKVDTFWYKEILRILKNKFWWVGVTEYLTEDVEAFCNYIDIPFDKDYEPENVTDYDLPRYWTLDQVMSQPDIEKILEAEEYDFKLYNFFKINGRPF